MIVNSEIEAIQETDTKFIINVRELFNHNLDQGNRLRENKR